MSELPAAPGPVDSDTSATPPGPIAAIFAKWAEIPLFIRIMCALVVGVILGVTLKERAAGLKEISGMVLALLRALATPLILLAILHSLLTANIGGKTARRLAFLLVTNTLAAICIGLIVANVVRPGKWGKLPPPPAAAMEQAANKKPYDPVADIRSKIPDNIVKPLYDDNVIAVIILALTFGVALRRVREQQIAAGKDAYRSVENFIETGFAAVMTALHWIIQLVPLAVLCVVASVIGSHGVATFISLAGFIVAVLAALLLQGVFYISRVSLSSWVKPGRFLSGNKDALLTAFSTASSTVTMPITYEGLKTRVGIREQSASLGALVGSNFNNDGTALYEAMAPLFIAQALGQNLSIVQQVVIAFMAVVASVGAAGIPEAGLVTMLLVFRSVNLPTEYVLLLLPVDWFLDRCRTSMNVMGDMTVSCCLDGKTPPDITPLPPLPARNERPGEGEE